MGESWWSFYRRILPRKKLQNWDLWWEIPKRAIRWGRVQDQAAGRVKQPKSSHAHAHTPIDSSNALAERASTELSYQQSEQDEPPPTPPPTKNDPDLEWYFSPDGRTGLTKSRRHHKFKAPSSHSVRRGRFFTAEIPS